VLVGYNDALYAFRDTLGIGIGAPISGVYVDWTAVRLEPGFSVWVLQPHAAAATHTAFMQGYDQAPTIPAIFAITNPLIGASP
jgi:threonine dehydratase